MLGKPYKESSQHFYNLCKQATQGIKLHLKDIDEYICLYTQVTYVIIRPS